MDVLNGYRDNHNVSSDSDSEDSDNECTVWKRATVKRKSNNELLTKEDEELKEPIAELKEQPPPAKRERKRNNIWCEVLQDQLISEDLEDCLLKNKPRHYGDRGKESYDYTLRYSDTRSEKDSDSFMSESGSCEEPSKSKIKHTTSFRDNVKKFVKLDSAERAAAWKINKVLNEKKFYLIQRIVKTVGIEKSMALLSMTQDIEDNGGMMINNNMRRRTPGGVYIQLLKTDKSVTQEMLDEIFEGEMSGFELKRYYAEKKKNKKKFVQKNRNKQKSNDSNKLPNIDKVQDPSEIVPMDAEVTADKNSENSGLENNSTVVPIFNKNSSERISDLEEGEIED